MKSWELNITFIIELSKDTLSSKFVRTFAFKNKSNQHPDSGGLRQADILTKVLTFNKISFSLKSLSDFSPNKYLLTFHTQGELLTTDCKIFAKERD